MKILRKFQRSSGPSKVYANCRKQHRQRRAYIARLGADADFEHEAEIIFERWKNFPDDHFSNSTAKKRRKTEQALDFGEGWACRLLAALEHPHAYTLHAYHLGLPPECADPANFYSRHNRDLWKQAIEASFSSPLHWKLELAERVHVHIIADRDAGLPHIARGGEVVKPIYDLKGWVCYLSKPVAQWNARNIALWLRARRQGRLPRLSGTMGVPNRKNFHKKAS